MKIVLKEGEEIMIDSRHECRTFRLEDGAIKEIKAQQVDENIWNCSECGCSWMSREAAEGCLHRR